MYKSPIPLTHSLIMKSSGSTERISMNIGILHPLKSLRIWFAILPHKLSFLCLTLFFKNNTYLVNFHGFPFQIPAEPFEYNGTQLMLGWGVMVLMERKG